MAIAGRVAIVPKGDWSADATYKRLDAVTYNNTLYFAKKEVPAGTATSNAEYWSKSVVGNAVTVDAAMSDTSEHPVQNKVIKAYVDKKASDSTDFSTSTSKLLNGSIEASMLVTNATKNLLKPTLQTTTKDGVTCTNNGDGTYTLNGTNTSSKYIYFDFGKTGKLKKDVCKFWGLKASSEKAYMQAYTFDWKTINMIDYSQGNILPSINNEIYLRVVITAGETVSNVVVKPMLTTDLSATYDDFVPYDGYEIKSCGKNLLDPNAAGTYESPHTENGVTFTKNNDGSWTINGTATGNVGMSVGNSGGDHTFIELEADAKAFLFGSSGVSGLAYGFYTNESKQISNIENIPKGTKIRNLWISCYKGNTFNNVKVLGVISYDLNLTNEMYVPYQESTVHIDPTTEFPLLGLKSFDGETNIISPGNVEVAFAKNDSGKAILGMCKPTVKNLVSTVEGNPLDATMGAQLKKEIDELKAKVDAMSTSTTTE